MVYTIAQTLQGDRTAEGQPNEELSLYDILEFSIETNGRAKMDAFAAMAMQPELELSFNWVEQINLNKLIRG